MTYYLLDNPNPHAAGGDGFHGYTSRRKWPRVIVLHTSESAFDLSGGDSGAEDVARYLSNTSRAASYHAIVDRDSTVRCLPWDYTAYGARGANADGIHIAVAGQAAEWDTVPASEVDSILDQLVPLVKDAIREYDIPAVRLSDDEAQGRDRGLAEHAQIDPARRSDPGPDFPWRQLINRLNGEENDMLNWSDWVPHKIRDWAVDNGLAKPGDTTLQSTMTFERGIVLMYRFWKRFL